MLMGCLTSFLLPIVIFTAANSYRPAKSSSLTPPTINQPIDARPANSPVVTAAVSATPSPPTRVTSEPAQGIAMTLRCTRASFGPTPSLDATIYGPGVTHLNQGTRYYQVYGRTIDEIRNQLVACSPLGHQGNAGASFGQLVYSYTIARGGGVCRVTKTHVVLYSARIIPSWSADQETTGPLTTKWNQFVAATITHEDGHMTIDRDYASRLVTTLDGMTHSDCILIDKLAMEAAAAIQAQLDSAQASYDARTHHGITQGATF